MNILKLEKKLMKKKEELKILSNKFRELKSLVYEYKEKKEVEIKKFIKKLILYS